MPHGFSLGAHDGDDTGVVVGVGFVFGGRSGSLFLIDGDALVELDDDEAGSLADAGADEEAVGDGFAGAGSAAGLDTWCGGTSTSCAGFSGGSSFRLCGPKPEYGALGEITAASGIDVGIVVGCG